MEKNSLEWLKKEIQKDELQLRTHKKNIISQIKKGGVGLYRSFVHYDVRGRNTRWKGKGVKDYRGEG